MIYLVISTISFALGVVVGALVLVIAALSQGTKDRIGQTPSPPRQEQTKA